MARVVGVGELDWALYEYSDIEGNKPMNACEFFDDGSLWRLYLKLDENIAESTSATVVNDVFALFSAGDFAHQASEEMLRGIDLIPKPVKSICMRLSGTSRFNPPVCLRGPVPIDCFGDTRYLIQFPTRDIILRTDCFLHSLARKMSKWAKE